MRSAENHQTMTDTPKNEISYFHNIISKWFVFIAYILSIDLPLS